jgi:hypothetical protein
MELCLPPSIPRGDGAAPGLPPSPLKNSFQGGTGMVFLSRPMGLPSGLAVALGIALASSPLAEGADPERDRFEKALAEVKGHLTAEDFAAAFDLLGEFEDPASPLLPRVLVEREKVVAAARKHLKEVEADALRLLSSGCRDEAIAIVQMADGKYPFAVEVERGKLLAKVSGAKSAGETEERPTAAEPRPAADLRGRALRALAALDFAAARAGLEEARAAAGGGGADLAALAEEAARAGGAWDGIRSALEKAGKKGAAIEIPPSLPSIGEPPAGVPPSKRAWKGFIGGIRGSLIFVSRAPKDTPGAYRILALPDPLLLDLLGSERKEAPEADAREALGLLLLHACGPARAAPLLTHPTMGEKAARYGDRLGVEAGSWLERKIEVLEERRKGLSGGDGKDPLATALLAEEYRDAIPAARSGTIPPTLAVRIRDGFLETRGASAPIASLFPGRKAEAEEGGLVRIVWEFAGSGQAEDFHAVGKETIPARIEKGKIRLQGEYRILEGDPFIERIAVRGTAADLSRAAPNVNVALWTAGADALTFRDGSTVSVIDRMKEEEKPIGDYFVFGMGYRTVVSTTMGKASEKLSIADTKDSVEFPAHVVLGGTRSRTVHTSLSECLWGRALKPPFPPRMEFSIDWRQEKVDWTVNRKAIPLMGVFARIPPAAERRGSATIFTNDAPLSLESLEVSGRIDPGWLAGRRKARAIEELREIAPSLVAMNGETADAET